MTPTLRPASTPPRASASSLATGSRARALSLREAPTRAFSAALGVGALSAREVRAAAATADDATSLAPMPKWGRESADALADVVEWSEWYELLARRSLARQEAGRPATSGGERQPYGGDAREAGEVALAVAGPAPGAVPVVGGGRRVRRDVAGAPPRARLRGVRRAMGAPRRFSLRAEAKPSHPEGKDSLPPIYSIDLVGFGHSEKPDLSYTQYVWESPDRRLCRRGDGRARRRARGQLDRRRALGGRVGVDPELQGRRPLQHGGVLLEPSE